MLEIASITAMFPILVVLRQGSCSRTPALLASHKMNKDNTSYPINWRSYMISLAIDICFVVLPFLSIITVLSDWVHVFAICLIFLVSICISSIRFLPFAFTCLGGTQSVLLFWRSLSLYRVSVMIVSCMCILAVDFKIFPRRYAKTEVYGTSLMDIGVGSFVMANALVSRMARNVAHVTLRDTFQSVSPLIFLGFGRLMFTAKVNYQVHVGEYGVHWNFFFTLAAIHLLTSVISINPHYCGVLGSSVLIVYQICLMCGLNGYLLSNERSNIVSQNKEGFFSIFGYWGMYLVAVQLGNRLFFRQTHSSKMRSVHWTIIRVSILSVLFWCMTFILDKYVEKVSRRMCNLAYVMLVYAQNFQSLAIFLLSDLLRFPNTSLFEAFDRNLLGMFLLANMLTGVINLSFDTLAVSPLTSFIILVGYVIVLSLSAVGLMLAGVKLKFH